ncbi:response regulator transcription factor [Cellulosilyticum sp. I15G10I2]|uniref:response regulator transcription factor n=1 Tax=Cellulosilyticum sp. I15G10I2 TaxID=1892843 RepID=UPI00085C936B|nr:response regulator transcription factor [Cellulosilyticum sp. I15G10I2]
MIKVLIVDDQELIRESLTLILNVTENIEIVGSASNGREAIVLTRAYKPDVILMDIRMPEVDGIECIKMIKEFYRNTKIIVLTTFDDDEYIYESLKNGADGFLLKGISKDELVKAILTVYNNGASIDPEIIKKVFSLFGKLAKSSVVSKVEGQDVESLSNNEIRIIQLIGRGLSNKEITQALNFSEGTVRNYISSILRKLNLRDRTQIAIFAVQSSIMLKDIEDKA